MVCLRFPWLLSHGLLPSLILGLVALLSTNRFGLSFWPRWGVD